MSRHPNRDQQQTADQNLATGLTKHAQTLTSFTIAGTSIATADIIAALQKRQANAAAVESTRATWRAAVQADRDERGKSNPIVSGVKQVLLVMFASSIDTLADFGLTPRKPRVVGPEVRVAAAAKARATRAARHTMGSNQKRAIKGSVTGVVMTPITTPGGGGEAPPAPAPSPTAPVLPPAPKPAG
jgi:hypothetical protein